MKKFLIVLMLLFLTSCTHIIGALQEFVNSDSTDDSNITSEVINPDNDFVDTPNVNELIINNGEKHHFNESLKKDGPMTGECFPSIGTPKLLVIPVTFTDSHSTSFHLRKYEKDLQKCFNGSEEETGYYSLNGFYKESSYGKLDVKADILDFYQLSQASRYYESQPKNNGSQVILEEVIRALDKTIDFSQYDYDNDGFIDGIWLVYDHSIDFNNANFWWAYQTQAGFRGIFDGKRPSYYGFASIDFIYTNKNGQTEYDKSGINIDAHTFIHETGHMMGLDDYYSYDLNQRRFFVDRGYPACYGTYGYDMMDATYGDHGVLSKLLLGWIDPFVITENSFVSLSSFAKTGDAILIPNNSKDYIKNMTIYAHYYLMVCYDESLINGKDKPINNPSAISTDGIVIYECHAEKPVNPGYYGNNYLTGFKYNNTDNKTFSKLNGFDYEKSEWFVRFLTNGIETADNAKVLFNVNDCLRNYTKEKTTVPFNFKVLRRDTINNELDKYVIAIKIY